MSDMYYTSSNF